MLSSVSALNKSAGGMWDDSFGSLASEGSASISQFYDTQAPVDASNVAPMEDSMSLRELPQLVEAGNADGSGSEGSFGCSPKKGEDDEEEDSTRQFAKQMGYAMMLQGGMHFAANPLMQLGKRLFRGDNNEEDVAEDAVAAQTILTRNGQFQHGVLNRGGDMSAFSQAGAHESSRNMTGAFVLQKDVA